MELGFSETFLLIYGAIQAALVVPIVQWLKNKIPGDFPISPVLITYAMSFLSAWGLTLIPGLEPAATISMCVQIAFIGQVGAQVVHSGYKTIIKYGKETI